MGLPALSSPELDRAFSALSDPTRREILTRLADGAAGVLQVAQPFPITQPAITKHLKVLEGAGLISRQRSARQILCRLEPERMSVVADWLGSYRESLVARFARLDDYLESLQGKGGAS
ncbi:MAG TPA: metalloregulator ArsR/SmtB family transcription factor [Candidatus Dormibacteraeota bacterium]|nr:metalloregulator ArsR/SmtB family transcription factor [Candidatus Dormibacteraeota bacterium]